MKIDLKIKTRVQGYSSLAGIHHSRIKAISIEEKCTNIHSGTIDEIIQKYGFYRKQYRLIKEPKGFIFREVICDTGINGHQKTMKQAIARALGYVTIYIDEEFRYSEFPAFRELESQHSMRSKGCKHESREFKHTYYWCPDCGQGFEYKHEVKS